jgi:solute carrier family 25 uncoupling protein 27
MASLADLVKVRMQADGRMVSQGLQPRYLGPFDALNKIVGMEGFGKEFFQMYREHFW